MGDWYQTDWFGSDWNSSQWFGESGSTGGITGTGSVDISAPSIAGEGYKFRRSSGSGKKPRISHEEEMLREYWRQLEAEEEIVLAAIQSFVQIEEVEWELLPTA